MSSLHSTYISTIFNFINQEQSPLASRPSTPAEQWGDPSMTLGYHTRNDTKHNRKTEAKGDENYGQIHPCYPCPHQIAGLRVIEVQHQLFHHQGPIDLEVPGIHTKAHDATGSQEPT